MKQLGKSIGTIACGALAAALLAAPVSAQTNGNAADPPAAYGNSGSTAAGPGTGASTRYNDSSSAGGNGGGWGIWGLVGLLGLFGLGYSGRSRNDVTYREEMPRSGRAGEVNTITDTGETMPRAGVPSSRVPPSAD
jgi:MYXO-CTERM domain-containing protein